MKKRNSTQASKRGRRKFHKVCQGCGGVAVYTYCDPCYENRKTLNAHRPDKQVD